MSRKVHADYTVGEVKRAFQMFAGDEAPDGTIYVHDLEKALTVWLLLYTFMTWRRLSLYDFSYIRSWLGEGSHCMTSPIYVHDLEKALTVWLLLYTFMTWRRLSLYDFSYIRSWLGEGSHCMTSPIYVHDLEKALTVWLLLYTFMTWRRLSLYDFSYIRLWLGEGSHCMYSPIYVHDLEKALTVWLLLYTFMTWRRLSLYDFSYIRSWLGEGSHCMTSPIYVHDLEKALTVCILLTSTFRAVEVEMVMNLKRCKAIFRIILKAFFGWMTPLLTEYVCILCVMFRRMDATDWPKKRLTTSAPNWKQMMANSIIVTMSTWWWISDQCIDIMLANRFDAKLYHVKAFGENEKKPTKWQWTKHLGQN